MEESMPIVVQTYWEVLCHFNICMDLYEQRKGGLSFAKSAKYLFTDIKLPKLLKASTLAAVESRVNILGKEQE